MEAGAVDATSWLLMLHFSLDAAQQLANDGIAAEVVDVRSLAPIDYQTIGDSVKKTGHLVNDSVSISRSRLPESPRLMFRSRSLRFSRTLIARVPRKSG